MILQNTADSIKNRGVEAIEMHGDAPQATPYGIYVARLNSWWDFLQLVKDGYFDFSRHIFRGQDKMMPLFPSIYRQDIRPRGRLSDASTFNWARHIFNDGDYKNLLKQQFNKGLS